MWKSGNQERSWLRKRGVGIECFSLISTFNPEVFVCRELGHEHVSIAFNEGADDGERSRCRHTDFYMEIRESGTELAAQTGIGDRVLFPDFLISTFNPEVLVVSHGQVGSR